MRPGRRGTALLGLLVALLAPAPAGAAADPVALVDPFVGALGNGHTFPGADVPFGMVQLGPDSVGAGPGGYRGPGVPLRGFAVTRLSGAGCTNYGDLPLLPILAPPRLSPGSHPLGVGIAPGSEAAHPGSYRVRLDSGVSVALTVTTRTGLGVFSFPSSAPEGTLLIDPSGSANPRSASISVLGRSLVVGSATSAAFAGACGRPPGSYTLYFALSFDRPFRTVGTWSGGRLAPGGRTAAGSRVGAFVGFDTRRSGTVRVKVGISYVSIAGARANLAAEATSWSFDRVEARARAQWAQALGRVDVRGGSRAQQTVFYTALYHSLLHPNVFGDADGRYLGVDGKVHVASGYTQYANVSGWDVYRSQIPLLALLAPQRTSDMIESLVADGQQAGRLPRWLVANAETGMMVGDPSDAIVADAYAFGVRGFDASTALQEMIAGASLPQGGAERPGLASYLSGGFVPDAASTTLEYAIADFAISQVAGALGDTADADAFLARSASWQLSFDPQAGFIVPRPSGGAFPATVDPASSSGFVEGNAAQYTWMVPQDMAGLLAALGPASSVAQRLDGFFRRLNAGPDRPYAWLGNEPCLGTPYAYLWLGLPWRSEAVVRRALANLFSAAPTGLPGNDDLGTLSSWYVWSALGLYPAIPGVGGLAVVSPLFPHATITLASGAKLQIDAPGAPSLRYVRALTVGGAPWDASWLPFSGIADGGSLAFSLGTSPSTWATDPASTPPSFPAAPAPGN